MYPRCPVTNTFMAFLPSPFACTAASSKNELSRMKGFGATVGRIAFDAANAHEPIERFRAKPRTRRLRAEVLEQELDLSRGHRLGERHIEVGGAEIALVLGDPVLDHQVIAEGVPSQ